GSVKYMIADEAAIYYQLNGEHIFKVAPLGVADAVASLTTALEINSQAWAKFLGGNVYIGPNNSINSGYADATDAASLQLNRYSVAGADTHFRDTSIYNGKNVLMTIWDGSAGKVTHSVDVHFDTSKYLYMGGTSGLKIGQNGTDGILENITGRMLLKTTSDGAVFYDRADSGAGRVAVGINSIYQGFLEYDDTGNTFFTIGNTFSSNTLGILRFKMGASTYPLAMDGAANLLGNSATPGTGAVGMFFMANGTLPSTFPNAGIGVDSGEVKVWDTSGNITTISPHGELDRFATFYAENPTAVPWTFTSRNPYTGRYQIINMGALVAAVEALTGKSYTVTEDVGKQEWATDQGTIKAQVDAERTAARETEVDKLVAARQAAEVATLVAASKAARDAEVVARAADLQATYGDAIPVLNEEGEEIATRTPTEQAELETDPALTKDQALAQVDVEAIRTQAEAETPAITPYETKQPPAWLAQRIAAVKELEVTK
ncbi:MAG: hypothetical protein ABIK12_10805, partial [Pseudomonadota bacterium]